MKSILADFEPKALFEHFEAITRIPHGSYNTAALADAIVKLATEKQYDVKKDDAGNVIVTVPATEGHEDAAPVIIQSHIDMVCDKVPGSTHDFEKDPLKLVIKGDDLYADGTTLGADDGAGVAMMLTLMTDTTITHPKLYLIFTTEEEVGMDGAYALDMSPFSDATMMINLDSEDEGTATVGCAGGSGVTCTFPLRRVKAKGLTAAITVSGLDGGHSGDEINRYGLNANVVMGKILTAVGKKIDFSIISLDGGTKDNAIPTSCTAKLMIGPYERVELDQMLNTLQQTFHTIAGNNDQNLTITVTYGDNKQVEEEVLGPDAEALVLFALGMAPNGVQSMGRLGTGEVDTSLNLGIVTTEDKAFTMVFNVRSQFDVARDMLCDKLTAFAEYLGGKATIRGQYPAWQKRDHSALFDTMNGIWRQMTGKPLTALTIHGGLECSLFSDQLPQLDIVSIGPNNKDIHTPNEHMSIPSFKRTYDFLLKTLEALA